MLHWTPEGKQLETGLNIYISFNKRFWFRVVLVTVDLPKNEVTSYKFRFRSFLKPFFIFRKSSWNILDSFKFETDILILSRECYLDNLPQMSQKLVQDIKLCTQEFNKRNTNGY